MIVADASVIVRGLESDGAARRLLVEEEIHVPHLADSEIAQVFRLQVMRGRLSAEVARSRITVWGRFGVRRHPARPLLGRVWGLRENLSAYDATYVALAEALDCPLATGDLRVARAPGPRCRVIPVRG